MERYRVLTIFAKFYFYYLAISLVKMHGYKFWIGVFIILGVTFGLSRFELMAPAERELVENELKIGQKISKSFSRY